MQYGYKPNEDGTYQIIDEDDNVFLDNVPEDQLTVFEEYASKNLAPRMEVAAKRSVQERNDQNVMRIRAIMTH